MRKFLFIILSLFLTMCDFSSETILVKLGNGYRGNITVTISNDSEKDFLVSNADIPFKNFEKDAFKIYDGNSFLPYIGKVFYMADDLLEEILIKAGENLEIPVNLINLYEFKYLGDYEVYIDHYITAKFLDGSATTVNVVSDTITMKISSEDLIEYEYNAMKSCQSNQITLLNRGKNISRSDIDNASNYLAKKKADSYYTKWFGSYNSTRFNTVVSGYKKTSTSTTKGWSYSCETKANGGCDGWAAYVYKGQPYKVWVCMDYYEKTSDRNRGTLMTHEASHWNINFGADDHGYGYNTGIELAKSDPVKAVNCANNIEYYTDDIPDAGDPPVDPDPDDDLAGFTLDKTTFKPYEIVTIRVSQLNKDKIYLVGIYNLDNTLWGSKKRTIQGTTQAVKQIKAPSDNGTYRVKLSVKDSGKVLHTLRFKVNDSDDPDPEDGPAGYTKCADENQSFTLPGICNVAYGAKGIFTYKYNVKGTITFNNDTFGDPVPGVFKAGYYKQVSDDPDPPVDNIVTVYQHDNYRGWGVGLKVDTYNINKMIGLGIVNDAVSSIKVKSGYEAIVYEYKDFKGISKVITKDISSFRTINFNDKTSSIKVQKTGTDPDPDPPSGDSLSVDEIMGPQEILISANKKYEFRFQKKGNLVLRSLTGDRALWDSGTHQSYGKKLLLQGDGNFVLYNESNKAVWSSSTNGRNATKVQVLDSGYLVIKNGNNIIWSRPKGDIPDPDPDPDPDKITHIGTNEVWGSNASSIRINRPSGSRAGDLLVLFLHRTDSDLTMKVSGWTRVAECFKGGNASSCKTADDCTNWNSDKSICNNFGGTGGHDLAQTVFYKKVSSNEPSSYTLNLSRESDRGPGWVILTALRGANTTDPVREWENTGCDGIADSLFPSVYGKKGDMVLLSQSFDDAIAQSKFNAPDNTSLFGYVSKSDEAGFLFGGLLNSSGETGTMKTHGEGGPDCKDALISLTIKPKESDDDGDNIESWKFVVAGDTRSNDSAHRNVLKAVKNNSNGYELYLNSGDVVNSGTSSSNWNTFNNAVNNVLGSNWKFKYLACPGNHDKVRDGGLSNWNKYLSGQANYRDKGRNFAYTHKNVTFIVLDADVSKDSQVSWIRSTVNNAKTTWIFAIWHYPNYYSQWISALGKFDGVFFGHEHKYRRENKGNYFGMVVGTGGAPLGSGNVYGYLECTVKGNKMNIKYIKASNGAVLDSATYTANNK